MGKKLAIKGHPIRGKEVIELLKMMGGTNPFSNNGMVIGNKINNCYYISEDTATKYISWDYIGPEEIEKYKIFTLEEFLEKYPFKVGDVIKFPNNMAEEIAEMKWYEELEDIIYTSVNGWTRPCSVPKNTNNKANMKTDCEKCGLHFGSVRCFDKDCPNNTPKDMEDNKLFGTLSNPLETKSYAVSLKDGEVIDNSIDTVQFIQSGKIVAVRFNTQNYENEVELQLGDYEIEVRDGKTYAVKKKSKYPTTYAECSEVLVGRKPNPNEISFDKMELCLIDLHNTQSIDFQNPYLSQLNSLFRLRMCRDAYWKVYGEETELGKPWEPAIQDTIWGITRSKDEVEKYSCRYGKTRLLEFPTEKMRDTFYENFKDLIEHCKELL